MADTVSTFKYDFFLSFAHEDSAFTESVYEKLKSSGFTVFYSDESLKKNRGQSFVEIIEEGLQNSEHFILCCSPNSKDAQWVSKETRSFFNLCHMRSKEARRMFVLKGPDFSEEFVPFLLSDLQMVSSAEEIIELHPKKNAERNWATSTIPPPSSNRKIKVEQSQKFESVPIQKKNTSNENPVVFTNVTHVKDGLLIAGLLQQSQGQLKIFSNHLEFISASKVIMVENIHNVTYGRFGPDMVNNWVKVEYSDNGKLEGALFMKSDLLSMFGGTKKLYEAIWSMTKK